MDVRDLSSGITLYLPILNPGALFSAGDALLPVFPKNLS
jgi:acetamidase/formamidase